MRLLLDNNLSPRLVDVLSKEGWDIVHVGSLGLRAASDRVVLQRARDDGRALVSADTDSARYSPPRASPGHRWFSSVG